MYSKARPVKQQKRENIVLEVSEVQARVNFVETGARLAYLAENNEAKTLAASCGHSNYGHVQCFRQQLDCHRPTKTRGPGFNYKM